MVDSPSSGGGTTRTVPHMPAQVSLTKRRVVDYGRREFQIKAYPRTGADVDRCLAGTCGTRLKG